MKLLSLYKVPKDINVESTIEYISKKSIFFKFYYKKIKDDIKDYISNNNDLNILDYNNEFEYFKSILILKKKYSKSLKELKYFELNLYEDIKSIENYFFNLLHTNNNIFLSRETEFNKLNILLNKKLKNNIILVGSPGTGKTTLVEKFAKNNNINILALNTASIMSNTKYRGEFEEKIYNISRVILKYELPIFIDELHSLINAGGVEGGISFNNLIKSSITNNNFILIGATTHEEFETISRDRAFIRRFNILYIEELSVIMIMGMYDKVLEEIHSMYFQDKDDYFKLLQKNKKLIVKFLSINIKTRFFPDKLIDFLDYAFAFKTIYESNINSLKFILKSYKETIFL